MYTLFYKTYQLRFSKIVKKFQNNQFENLQKASLVQRLYLFYFGIKNAYPYVLNGSYLKWLITDTVNPSWFLFALLFLTNFISHSKAKKTLIHLISSIPNKTFREKFLFTEYIRINPKKLKDAKLRKEIQQINQQINSYQIIEKNCIDKLGLNVKDNFILLDILNNLKSILKNSIRYLDFLSPNNISVFHCHANYFRKVKHSEEKASNWDRLISDFRTGSVLFFNNEKLHIIGDFPKLQYYTINQMIKKEQSKVRKTNVGFRTSSYMREKQLSFTNNALLKKRGILHHILPVLLFIILGILILSYYCSLYKIYQEQYDNYYTTYETANLFASTDRSLENLTASVTYLLYLSSNDLETPSSVFEGLNKSLSNFQSMRKALEKQILATSYKIKAFNETFFWLQDEVFLLPSINSTLQNLTLNQVYQKIESLVLSAFPNSSSFVVSSDDDAFFFPSLFYMKSIIDSSTLYFYNSIPLYTQESTNEYYHISLYSNIPSLIICLILLFYPFLYLIINKQLGSFFDGRDNSNNTLPLAAYIPKQFKSLTVFILRYFFALIMIVSMFFISLYSIKALFDSADILQFQAEKNMNNLVQMDAITYSLVDLLIYNITSSNFTKYSFFNESMLYSHISECIDSLTNNTDTKTSLNGINNKTSLYQLSLNVLNQIYKVNETIVFLSDLTNESYNNLLFPLLDSFLDDVFIVVQSSYDYFYTCYYTSFGLDIMFFSISVLFYFLLISTYSRLDKTFLLMGNLVSFISEEKIRQKNDDIHSISPLVKIKDKTVLELYNKPAALIDKNDIICSANYLFYQYIRVKPDDAIGKDIKTYLSEKMFRKPIDTNYKIALIKADTEVDLLKMEVEKLQLNSNMLHSTTIPEYFLNSPPGRHYSKFVSKIIFLISPENENSLLPEQWIKEEMIFENWLKRRSKSSVIHADILRSDSRHLVALFGADGSVQYSPEMFVLSAFQIAIDSLRFVNEKTCNYGGLQISIGIASTYDAIFVVSMDPIMNLKIKGDLPQKSVQIQASLKTNSIVMCQDTFEVLTKCSGFPLVNYVNEIKDNEKKSKIYVFNIM